MIAVMVELADEPLPVRHFYAVAKPDQGRAEWAAVDCATALGMVATSPVGGVEPVEAVAPLALHTVKQIGLAPGQVKAMGRRWPRRWLGPAGVRAGD
jgi:hypothetical protein